MHLKFSHHGRQFFFLTFCVNGRRRVLSQLVAGELRPRLTRAGECVKALWLAVHGLNPALTASEYVIMPDHVHLLLIVDYEVDPVFDPMVFVHWFRGESARMISTDGAAAPNPAGRAAMPLAGCEVSGEGIRPLPPLPTTLPRYYKGGEVVAGWAGEVAAGRAGEVVAGRAGEVVAGRGGRGSGAQPQSFGGFWERGFWLDLSFDARQLKAIRRYIRHNPLRALWKQNNPDMFIRRANFRHPILDPAFPWSACGDLTLLANPFLVAVSLTRRLSVSEHEATIAELVEKARQGWVVVCGFISPGEKELGRRLKAEPRARWIKTMAQGLPPRFDPSVEDSRYLAGHRQLLLSALPVNAPFDWHSCHWMNDLAAAMCKKARGEEG